MKNKFTIWLKQQKVKYSNREFQKQLLQKFTKGFIEGIKSLKPCCLK